MRPDGQGVAQQPRVECVHWFLEFSGGVIQRGSIHCPQPTNHPPKPHNQLDHGV